MALNSYPTQPLFPPAAKTVLLIRWISIIWGYVEIGMAKIFPTQWVLRGGCQKSGLCCKLISMDLHGIARLPFLYKVISKSAIWWNEKINGFTYTGQENRKVLAFTCNRLGKDNTCMDYKNRPRICREFPQVKYFGKPLLYKGCGFRVQLKPTKSKLAK